MTTYIAGNLLGRLVASWVIVWLVCWVFSRFDWRVALRRSRRWPAWLAVAALFALGLGQLFGKGAS
ncbi:hypothetical protein V4F39_17230 [Aquincola sp. MAHUQ-54]|uniref:Uncharacterized protein n=1 Tax=Aquincola agrisoli TaxID=3119538 RepID=A0AAW9Q9F0_9BURK